MAVVVAVELMPTATVRIQTVAVQVVLVAGEEEAPLVKEEAPFSTERQVRQILVVAVEELTLNQLSQAMADQELSLFVT
jgi:hypothetical protein